MTDTKQSDVPTFIHFLCQLPRMYSWKFKTVTLCSSLKNYNSLLSKKNEISCVECQRINENKPMKKLLEHESKCKRKEQ